MAKVDEVLAKGIDNVLYKELLDAHVADLKATPLYQKVDATTRRRLVRLAENLGEARYYYETAVNTDDQHTYAKRNHWTDCLGEYLDAVRTVIQAM